MNTTAVLTIEAFRTTLFLTGDDRERLPLLGINVLGDGGDGWTTDHVTYFQSAADRELAQRGYKRAGDWTYDTYRDAYVATIAAA